MSEKSAYNALRINIKQHGDRIDRIENLVGTGFPDVNYCLRFGREGWIELKAPTEPKRSTTKLFGSNHDLSQEQKNWFLSQCNAGGQCYIFIETDKRRMLIEGVLADRVNDMTVPELIDEALWVAPRRVIDKNVWGALRAILMGL